MTHDYERVERRLAALEALAMPAATPSSEVQATPGTLAGPPPLARQLQELHEAILQTAALAGPNAARLLGCLSELRELEVGSAALDDLLLTPAARAELVCASEARLRRLAAAYGELVPLKGLVADDAVASLAELAPRLGAIAAQTYEQDERCRQLGTEVAEAAAQYAAIIDDISAIFADWDRRLAVLERLVRDEGARQAS